MSACVILMTIIVVQFHREEKAQRKKQFSTWGIPFSYVATILFAGGIILGQSYFAWGFFKAAGLLD